MNSATTQGDDARIRKNLEVMASDPKRYSDADMRAYLQDIEGVDPAQYLGGGGVGRVLGLAARGAAQGLGGMADLATMPLTAPQRLAAMATGAPQPPSAQALAQATANKVGLPTPNTPGERVGVAAAEGAAMSLPFAGAGAVGAVAGPVLGAGANAAGQAAEEQGAGMLGQMAASLTVGAGVPVLASLGPAIIKAALRGTAARAESARQALALVQAGSPNAPVTLGQVASGGVGRTLEGQLRRSPASGERFHRVLDAQAEGMKARAAGIADQITPGSAPTVEVAGMTVQRGIQRGWLERFKAQSEALYQKVWSVVPDDLPVQPANVVRLFAEQGRLASSARPFSEGLVAPAMQRWAGDLAETLGKSPQGIPLETLKVWRSQLGEMLTGANLIEGIKLGDVRQLYGAVTADMRAAIAQANPRALQSFDRASLHYRVGMDRLEGTLQALIDKNTAETAYRAMIAGTREGATTLRRTMHSLLPPERRIVASAVVRRMGLADPSKQDDLGAVFDPEKFLSNWARFAPEAKSALFDGLGDPSIRRNLDALAKAMNHHRQMNAVLKRPGAAGSRTALMDVAQGLVWASAGMATGHPVMALAGSAPIAVAAGSNLAAKAFTNPKVIHWLVRQSRVPAGAITQELALLAKQAQDWAPEDRMLAQEIVGTLGKFDWHQLRLAQAVSDALPSRQTPPGPTPGITTGR